jgi:hypothetical protein
VDEKVERQEEDAAEIHAKSGAAVVPKRASFGERIGGEGGERLRSGLA